MNKTKTDNSNLPAKLALRRYFLQKYHATQPPDVLDCCQGDGTIWRRLRERFPVRTYWGVDKKQKRGRLKIDSVEILQQPGWRYDVIDVDTHGLPWKHWEALLPNLAGPASVFLTIGFVRTRGGSIGAEAREAMGLGGLKLPRGFQHRLHHVSLPYCLARAGDHGLEIVEAMEAPPSTNARYIGLHLRPRAV